MFERTKSHVGRLSGVVRVLRRLLCGGGKGGALVREPLSGYHAQSYCYILHAHREDINYIAQSYILSVMGSN